MVGMRWIQCAIASQYHMYICIYIIPSQHAYKKIKVSIVRNSYFSQKATCCHIYHAIQGGVNHSEDVVLHCLCLTSGSYFSYRNVKYQFMAPFWRA